MKTLILLLAASLFVSCAFNKDNNGVSAQDQRDQENSAKLQTDYSAAQGLYLGTVKAIDREMPVELRLFPQQIESGTSSDGQSRPLPVLKALLTLPDTLENDVKLSATFKAATGDLTLSIQGTKPAAEGGGTTTTTCDNGSLTKNPLDYSFVGKQNGPSIDGILTSNEGVVGPMHLELASKAAGIVSSEDRSNRFKKLITPIDGTYVTKIKSITGNNIPVIFAVTFSGGIVPSLTVTCRLEINAGQPMQIYFSPNPKPSRVTFKETPGTPKNDRCFLNNVDGTLNSDGNIDAYVTTIWTKREKTTLIRCLTPEKIKDCINAVPDPTN